ncbi:MAG: putative signal transducing protein [Gemmatimonadota bacterium]
MANDTVVIRRFISELDAELARSVLEANGIPAVILRDDAGGMLPSLPYQSQSRLEVRTEDAEEARALLEAGDG